MQSHQSSLYLYLLILGLLLFLVITALGGGLFEQGGLWRFQWQHEAFYNFCHQNPIRSYWINGQPMAVCSRCFGIYTGFLLGWIFLPLISFFNNEVLSAVKKVLFVIIFINALDIIGNIIGFWQNTLGSRLVLGWLIGWTTAMLFSGDFFKSKFKLKKDHHGRISTADIRK